MSLFLDASSRPWRVLTVVVLGLAVSLTTATPARAATTDCEQVRRQVAEWVVQEATTGVPSSLLKKLRNLGPSQTGCDRDDPDGYQGMGNDTEQWRPLVALYFDPEDVDRAMCLMEKESGGNPEARNPSTGAAGLMQVMPFWAETHGYDYEVLFNPAVNLWIAGQIRDQQGWQAWSPYLRGECRYGSVRVCSDRDADRQVGVDQVEVVLGCWSAVSFGSPQHVEDDLASGAISEDLKELSRGVHRNPI